MSKRKIRLFVILALSLLFFGITFFYTKYENKDHANQIVLHGNVDIRQVDLGFRVSGRLLTMNFEEGDEVKAGDVLAHLDNVPYEQNKNLIKSQMEVNLANLTKFEAGNRPQEIQEAKALVNEREVNFDNAQKTAKRQADLVTKNYASKQAYDDAIAQAKEAEAQLKTAKEALKLAEEGFRLEDILAAKSQLAAAYYSLKIAETSLEDTTLVAPSNGIIMTRIKEIGTILSAGDPIYTLSLKDPIMVRAYVSEYDLGRIKPGMSVNVYTDTQPRVAIPGQVGFISPQAEFTPKNVETKEIRTDLVYRVRIVVKDPENKLRQGMPVTAIVELKHG